MNSDSEQSMEKLGGVDEVDHEALEQSLEDEENGAVDELKARFQK